MCTAIAPPLPPEPGWQWQGLSQGSKHHSPPSPQWPNHEVGLVQAKLWAWSPLSRQQRPNAMAGAMGPRVGASPGPWCSPGAGTGWGHSLRWGCSRGPTCALGLLQEGRGEVQGLGVEGVVVVSGKHRVQTLLVYPVFGGKALPWEILLVHPDPWGRTLSSRGQSS